MSESACRHCGQCGACECYAAKIRGRRAGERVAAFEEIRRRGCDKVNTDGFKVGSYAFGLDDPGAIAFDAIHHTQDDFPNPYLLASQWREAASLLLDGAE